MDIDRDIFLKTKHMFRWMIFFISLDLTLLALKFYFIYLIFFKENTI